MESVLIQFEILSDGLSGTGGYGGITQLASGRWALYKETPFSKGKWRYVGERGFVPPEEEIENLERELQEPARQIFHAGIQPQLCSLKVAKLRPGEYHPRIWRGRYDPRRPFEDLTVNPESKYGTIFVQSMTSAISLFDELAEVFKFIEPADENLGSFGHKMRQLLILACTEVEANLRSVYLANFPSEFVELRTSTRHYVQLLSPMNLGGFGACLKSYPDVPMLAPYRAWTADKPTQSLPWYDAYNAVKHDREQNFSKSTLLHVLHAMAALHIILCAQWGPSIFVMHRQNYPSPFVLSEVPEWSIGEFYYPAIDLEGDPEPWRRVPYAQQRS